MSHSGRDRHRDHPLARAQEQEPKLAPHQRTFTMSGTEREEIAACLRRIDEARETLELQHSAANRTIVRELRAAADQVYDVLNELEEITER